MVETRSDETRGGARRVWLGAAMLGILLVALAGAIWSSGVLGSKPDVTVPDVVGMTVGGAREELRGAGLGVERTESAYSVKAAQGTVLAQSPSAGSTVPRGTELTLKVAEGVRPGTVPDVTAVGVEEAVDAVEAAGYTVEVKTKATRDVKPGVVLGQSPSAGVASAGSTVTLVVAVGVTPDVETPNVIGVAQPAAVSILHEAGLSAISYWVPGSGSREVVSQYPPPGMLVAAGAVVELSIPEGLDESSPTTEGINP